jgi:hypothetical protein
VEKLFVRILNVSLLVAAFICLAVTVVTAAVALISLSAAYSQRTSSSKIEVTYRPISVVSASATVPRASSGGNQGGERSGLRAAIDTYCNTLALLDSKLSENKLVHSSCVGDMQSVAQPEGDRTENYFEQKTSYLKAALTDPQLATKYPPTSDSTLLGSNEDQIVKPFEEEFAAKAGKDDQDKAAAEVNAGAQRLSFYYEATIAAGAFLMFVLIAFLIVATRIERHLESIQAKV